MMVSYLELRGLPSGARVTVDGMEWHAVRQEVAPGMHRIEVRARGYDGFRDSIVVDVGTTAVRDVQMVRQLAWGSAVEIGLEVTVFSVAEQAWERAPSNAGPDAFPIGLTTRVMVNVAPWIGIAASYATNIVYQSRGSLNDIGVSFVVGPPRRARLWPYLLAGLYVTSSYIGKGGVDRDYLYGQGGLAGVGARWRTGRRTTLMAEVRGALWRAPKIGGGADLTSFWAGLGVSYGIGGRWR